MEFYNGLVALTDYGACCLITPYLNFVDPVSKHLDPYNITGHHWHSVPRGVQNGPKGGIKFVLDAETFAFAPMGQESVGFRTGFADTRDKPMIKQESFMISPGTYQRDLQLSCHIVYNIALHFKELLSMS